MIKRICVFSPQGQLHIVRDLPPRARDLHGEPSRRLGRPFPPRPARLRLVRGRIAFSSWISSSLHHCQRPSNGVPLQPRAVLPLQGEPHPDALFPVLYLFLATRPPSYHHPPQLPGRHCASWVRVTPWTGRQHTQYFGTEYSWDRRWVWWGWLVLGTTSFSRWQLLDPLGPLEEEVQEVSVTHPKACALSALAQVRLLLLPPLHSLSHLLRSGIGELYLS